MLPIATYRVQLSHQFRFADLIDQLDYLRDLGISHVYASPILQASPDSTHGYDVIDWTRVNEELGGEEEFRRLSRALNQRGMGLILDIVPNHMSIDSPDNIWWQDILENGPSSRYAEFFDIAWHSAGAGEGKVLSPILSDHYGRVLENRSIRLARDGCRFLVSCSGQRMPLSAESAGGLLREACDRHRSDELDFLGRSLQSLPKPRGDEREAIERRDRDKRLLYQAIERVLAEQPEIRSAIDQVVEVVNHDLERLDELLRAQSYRLAYWRVSAQQLGYRRFFDVDALVALRAEAPQVFEATHETLLRLYREGCVQGMRVDHVDGIRKPQDYLRRLRESAPEAWIIVEKIQEPDEGLPCGWPVEGTTGYDFLFEVGNLFVDRCAEQALTFLYQNFTGDRQPYVRTARLSKRLALHELFGSDLRRLLSLFQQICDSHRRHRDYLETELEEALEHFITALPVYRTYVDAEGRTSSAEDTRYIEQTINDAKTSAPQLDPQLFDLLRDLMLLRVGGSAEADFVMRMQQLSGAVTAKGVEDTAFYRYHRLTALNEVGGNPSRFGISLEEFHERARKRQSRLPFTLLATSTHDTKRSEDVRIRICALTETPERWAQAVREWSQSNEKYRSNGLPDRGAEYLFYQTVVGAWPLDAARGIAYMLKAAREAKEHTTWTRPEKEYEDALCSFVEQALGDGSFRREVEAFVGELLPTSRVASLSQTLIKLTAPGVPDLYQGSELWHLRLVDPDNRGPVDCGLRRELLRDLDGIEPQQIQERADEGLPKLWLIRETLALRRERRTSFGPAGAYQPLVTAGERADCLVAFVRGGDIATLAPRLPRRTAEGWADTTVELPPGLWRSRLGGQETPGGRQFVEPLLRDFPVGLYAREAEA